MGEITQEANIEIVEKLANGNYKIKYPKTQVSQVVGLDIATQAEAEAGTSNVKYMTPLRVKEAIVGHTIQLYNNDDIQGQFSYINYEIDVPANGTREIPLYISQGRMTYIQDDGGAGYADAYRNGGAKIFTVLKGIYYKIFALSGYSYLTYRFVIKQLSTSGELIGTYYSDYIQMGKNRDVLFLNLSTANIGSINEHRQFEISVQVKNSDSSPRSVSQGASLSGVKIDGYLPLKGI